MAEGSVRNLAQIIHFQGCFSLSLKKRRQANLELLDGREAQSRLLEVRAARIVGQPLLTPAMLHAHAAG